MAQTTPNTPLARVKAGFGTKKDLIEKLKGLAGDELWTDRLNKDKGFASISNTKLLRLHAVLSDVKQRFGTREKLIAALVTAEGRGKDESYKKHFTTWPLPRLLDALRSAEHRSKRKGAAVAATTAEGIAARSAAKKTAAAKAGAKKSAATAAQPVAARAAAKKNVPSTTKKSAPAGAKKGVAKKTAAAPKKK